MNETPRERTVRRSRIGAKVYASWVAKHVANGRFQDAPGVQASSEEHGQIRPVSAEADHERHRRTIAALQVAGLIKTTKQGDDHEQSAHAKARSG